MSTVAPPKRRVKYRRKPLTSAQPQKPANNSAESGSPTERANLDLANDLTSVYKQKFSERIQRRKKNHGPWCKARGHWLDECDCQTVYSNASLCDPEERVEDWLDSTDDGQSSGSRRRKRLRTSIHSATSISTPPSLAYSETASSTSSSLPDVHFESKWYVDLCRSSASTSVVSSLANILLFGTVSKGEQEFLGGLAAYATASPQADQPHEVEAEIETDSEAETVSSETASVVSQSVDSEESQDIEDAEIDYKSVKSDGQWSALDFWNCMSLPHAEP